MLKRLCNKIKRIICPVCIKGCNNSFSCKSKIRKGFKINLVGSNNIVDIGTNCLLTNTNIQLHGNDSKIIIEDNVRFMGPCQIIMGGNSTLIIKNNAGIRGVEFNLDGAKIEVGELCMFSYGIVLRNHDSHKILDSNTGTVINPPKDIVLGRHVWVGQNATILKGSHIGENSVIGFGSVVTKSCKAGSVVAGCPAQVVKENISWDY